MAVSFFGSIAGLKLVWLQWQAPTSESGICIPHLVQPLQTTLVSSDSELRLEKVHLECFNSQADCKALLNSRISLFPK